MTWCLEPALRRSVGFGPVFSPRATRGATHYRRRPSADPGARVAGARRGALRADAARHRRVATGPGGANRCSPSRSPFHAAASATAARLAAQRECRSTPHDQLPGDGPSAGRADVRAWAAVVRGAPRGDHRLMVGTCPTVPSGRNQYKCLVTDLSSRAMARTGLRMMPTFPSSPLKFRTAGFPQYGFKASMSVGVFRSGGELKPSPDIRSSPSCYAPAFVHVRVTDAAWALSPTRLAPRRTAVQAAIAALPQGSLAPERVLLSRPIVADYDPIRQSPGHATISRHCRLYVAPSLCGSASATHETFPTFTATLSTRAIDHTPVGPPRHPVACARRGTRLPRFQNESPPTTSVSASYPRREEHFGAASFALGYGPRVCLALLTGYRTDGITCVPPIPSEDFVTPAFGVRPSPTGAGNQARWANGKSPIVGTCTRPVMAASEAALEMRSKRFGGQPPR